MADMLLTRLHFRHVIRHSVFYSSVILSGGFPHLCHGNGLHAIVVHDDKFGKLCTLSDISSDISSDIFKGEPAACAKIGLL